MIRQNRVKRSLNGKVIKTAFDRMPSPSSFGGGIKLRQNENDEEHRKANINTIDRADYEDEERSKKPFADFKRPEFQHLNKPFFKDYLKQPQQKKFKRKPLAIA